MKYLFLERIAWKKKMAGKLKPATFCKCTGMWLTNKDDKDILRYFCWLKYKFSHIAKAEKVKSYEK